MSASCSTHEGIGLQAKITDNRKLWQQIVVFTVCIGGNDKIIRKATDSLLRHTQLCMQSSSCYFEL